jgi:hypothetical protein
MSSLEQWQELTFERRWHAARLVFLTAGTYGFIVLLPLYAMEAKVTSGGPALNYPEYYYGFVGTALSMNALFLLIARDPLRWYAAIPLGVLEKLAFALPAMLLWWLGRSNGSAALFALIDLVWAVAFVLCWQALRPLAFQESRNED